MATRLVVPPQQGRGIACASLIFPSLLGIFFLNPASKLVKGEAVLGEAKPQKKNGGGEGRPRRALGDIGNQVTLRGIEGVKPNRPKQAIPNVAGPQVVLDGVAMAAKREAPIPAHRKPTVKPSKTQEVRSDQETHKDKSVTNKKEGDHANSKKKPHTLTSVLTARSKAACGVTNKPKEQIVDIDAADASNELAAVEYIEDIYKFYKLHESRPRDYIHSQPEINERMRAILIDWLTDVHTKFDLSLETLYLTINIIDRFLSIKTVPRKELQLVGITAMLMASKYEEIWPPQVNDFVCLSDRAYTHQQILAMEKTILGKLEWTLTVPTHYVFLVRFTKASVPDEELENMVHFLSELGMMNYAPTIMYCPSMVAASAVLAARDCARLLVSYHSMAGNGKLQAVYKKYSDFKRGAVALNPPAKNLMPTASAAVTRV
ncbi:G2/mitotic-specific cyclin S13-7 [Senna tora]|uniref:B-like cyclin n=1 Tax=Senna tora TaxID=362788 RepID=A0A834SGF0_9FABA|nr:G2/mitotic-specific cyclin S13-7 [Senna tora]